MLGLLFTASPINFFSYTIFYSLYITGKQKENGFLRAVLLSKFSATQNHLQKLSNEFLNCILKPFRKPCRKKNPPNHVETIFFKHFPPKLFERFSSFYLFIYLRKLNVFELTPPKYIIFIVNHFFKSQKNKLYRKIPFSSNDHHFTKN